ncbi:MAG: gfo/Idh/MocA family oxidoreductase, partial [Caldilineaceae bacterium]|nr:gfo/Idh/MocA family oxidoreductase [Caldilineaceae bacterium]
IMGGLSGFNATFTNRINTWIDEVTSGVPRDQIDASGKDGLAVQEVIEAAIGSFHTGRAEEVPIA